MWDDAQKRGNVRLLRFSPEHHWRTRIHSDRGILGLVRTLER